MSFEDPGALKGLYPGRPARLRHGLCAHPLFAMDRLIGLCRALPSSFVEYNAGDLPIGQDPAQTPMNGLSAEETIRRIAECRSWLVLKNVERDPDYKALLDAALAPIAPVVAAKTGAMARMEGFIFISSPDAVTPFHMDPEHNILMQIRGSKTFTVYDRAIVTDAQHEAYHAPGGHRNLQWTEEMESAAAAFDLAPGEALYVPVKAPHRVKVGPDPSISFSVTWRSAASDAEARVRRVNRALRRAGFKPAAPGAHPAADLLKAGAHRALSRLGLFRG